MSSILIIDDDIELCKLLRQYLEEENFYIVDVHDGKQGLESALQNKFLLIVLDLMLPMINGMEVLRKIREQSNIPIIILTARGDENDKIIGLEMGADDYLSKPFNPRELLARIRAILRRTNKKEVLQQATIGNLLGNGQ
jgi:two-component system response regulator CpxR